MINKINSQDLDFQVDINEATLAIKENRFFDAFNLLEINKLNDKDWQTTVVNDFETALLPNYPKLAALKHDLLALNPFYVSMSGSGSSFFAFFA